METVSLAASARADLGKGAARKIRQAGGLPAVIYQGGTESLPITIDPKEFKMVFRRANNPNVLVGLAVGGAERVCLVKDIQRHPVTYEAEHVDFYEVDPEKKVTVTVRVATTGNSAGVKTGGTLRLIRRELVLQCKPGQIPEAIVIDITDLDVAQFVKISQVTAPEGCTFVFTTDFNVLTVMGKRADLDVPVVAASDEVEEEA